MYEKITNMTVTHIMQRDIENFIAYFKLVLSTSRLPKKLKFEQKLIRAFVDRTYTEFTASAQELRANRLYDYLKGKIDEGTEIQNQQLERLETALMNEKKPSLGNIMEHAQIAMILKWLQGPVKGKLSKELQDYIVSLGTAYGKSQRQLVPNVEWKPREVSKQDMDIMKKEYKSFEAAINDSLKAVKEAHPKKMDPGKYQDQFRIIISSLDNLVKMSDKGMLNSVQSFKDKVIVSTALIYIQDEFVRKDPQLRKIIQLLISLYYQFRDKP
jgi:soluble cytochrome b562